MKTTQKNRKEKVRYNQIVKFAKDAEKQALKFIKNNTKLDPQLRVKYLT